ncbi:MAG: hypothetical protein ABIS26_02000 [Candidatus Paceibacterota bacterium]
MKTNFKKFNKVPLLISLFFFLSTLGSYIFLYKGIEKNNKASEEAAAESQAETLKREEIKSLDRTLKASTTEQAIIDTHFIKAGDIVPLLDEIEKIASIVKTKAEVIQVDVAPDNNSISVGVNVNGTFEGIYKFLTLIENSNYQLEIVSMDIQRVSVPVQVETTPVIVPETTNPATAPTPTSIGTDTTSTPPTITTPVPPKISKMPKFPHWSSVFKIKLLSYLKS